MWSLVSRRYTGNYYLIGFVGLFRGTSSRASVRGLAQEVVCHYAASLSWSDVVVTRPAAHMGSTQSECVPPASIFGGGPPKGPVGPGSAR